MARSRSLDPSEPSEPERRCVAAMARSTKEVDMADMVTLSLFGAPALEDPSEGLVGAAAVAAAPRGTLVTEVGDEDFFPLSCTLVISRSVASPIMEMVRTVLPGLADLGRSLPFGLVLAAAPSAFAASVSIFLPDADSDDGIGISPKASSSSSSLLCGDPGTCPCCMCLRMFASMAEKNSFCFRSFSWMALRSSSVASSRGLRHCVSRVMAS
mmetsp:Transcript_14380/g.27333  ORF Transcript_14380/g.27333 Transcript_14380/m.27333 type:complete len:212 (+) Transcript_14380:1570-2205(+)